MPGTGFDKVPDKGCNIVTGEGKVGEASYKGHTTVPECIERRGRVWGRRTPGSIYPGSTADTLPVRQCHQLPSSSSARGVCASCCGVGSGSALVACRRPPRGCGRTARSS